MKLYNFSEWKRDKHTIQLTEWETNEVFFKKEFSRIEKGWVVIDVGSEYGYYAIKAGLIVGDEGKVLAIEAHPKNCSLLKKNIRLYNLANRVIPICKAVGKEKGMAKLHETISPGSTSIIPRQSPFAANKNRLLMWLELAKRGDLLNVILKRFTSVSYAVPVDTLDGIAEEYGLKKINLVKIDVEGAELDVLRGSRDMLEKHKPVVLVEVHHFGMKWNPETLYRLLQKAGYRLAMEKRRQKILLVAYPQ